jgi:hypothetical protein
VRPRYSRARRKSSRGRAAGGDRSSPPGWKTGVAQRGATGLRRWGGRLGSPATGLCRWGGRGAVTRPRARPPTRSKKLHLLRSGWCISD